jgi:cytochrome c
VKFLIFYCIIWVKIKGSKMKKIILLSICFLVSSNLSASPKKLFEQKCTSCHSLTKPKDMSNVVAPAIMGVMRHVKMYYSDKTQAVAFMKDYILNPSKEKSLCQPQKLERFGVMPSLKGVVSTQELDIILPWVYDNYPPKGVRGMGHKGMR